MIASSQAATLRALASRLRTRVARSAHKSEVLELIDLLDVALVDTVAVAACTGCEPPGCGTCAPMPEPDLAPAPSVPDKQTSPATPLAVETKPPAETETGGGACAGERTSIGHFLRRYGEEMAELQPVATPAAPTVERLLELAKEARRLALDVEAFAARVRAACGGPK